MRPGPLLLPLLAAIAIGAVVRAAEAEPRGSATKLAAPRSKAKAPKAKNKKEQPAPPQADAEARGTSSAQPEAAAPQPSAAPAGPDKEKALRRETSDPDAPSVVESKEKEEGVKSYKFGAVEVEGRLKSPQVIYFLRRVRAEFSAADLGHRSFLRELSHTRHNPAFR